MALPARTVRILGASGFAVFLVALSFVFTSPSFLPKTKSVNAEDTEKLLRAYTQKDTDSDGLPDWQEALYGTDPNKKISTKFGVSDGEAASKGLLTPQTLASLIPKESEVTAESALATIPGTDPAPGSVTEQFSKEFLKSYVAQSNGTPMGPEAQQKIIDKLLLDFGARTAAVLDSTYTLISLHTSVGVSLLDYAGSVEKILTTHDIPADAGKPIPLMEALIQKNDASAKEKLLTISDTYRAISNDLVALSIPPSLSAAHLALVQSFDSLARSTKIIANFEKDPLAVLGAVSVFKSSSVKLGSSVVEIGTKILSQGEPSEAAPGSLLVYLGRLTQKNAY
jgi:hypothetical protein